MLDDDRVVAAAGLGVVLRAERLPNDFDGVSRRYQCNRDATVIAVAKTPYESDEIMPLCEKHEAETRSYLNEDGRSGWELHVTFHKYARYEAPYSEVLMHIGLAGKTIVAYVTADGTDAQVIDPVLVWTHPDTGHEIVDWEYVSHPIGLGESGLRLALQNA